MLVCYLCMHAFLAVIAMSLSRQFWNLILPSEFDDDLPARLAFRCSFWVGFGISPTVSTIAIVLIAAVFLEYPTVSRALEIGTAILMSTGLAVSLIVVSKGKARVL